MNTITNLLAGNVHVMHTAETSKPRMLVLNHTTKQAWVNVTLSCNTCPACQKRVARAGERPLFEVKNGVVDGLLWARTPYPENGNAEYALADIFTPSRVEKNVSGVLSHAQMVDGCITWDTDE